MAGANSNNTGVGLSDVLKGIWRRKSLVLSLWLLGTALGYAAIKLIEPKYQTESRVLIGVPENAESQTGTPRAANSVVDERKVQSELAVMQSNDLAARVIEQLRLTENPIFIAKSSQNSGWRSKLISWGLLDSDPSQTPEQVALDEFTDNISVYPLPLSNVIGIKYNAPEPKVAAEIANAVAETYVRSTQELQADSTVATREWLAAQIEDLRRKVSIADAEVERYRSEQGLLQGENSRLGAQEISELNSQITLAEAAKSEAEARSREIRDLLSSKGSVDTATEVLASSTVSGLRDQQLTATRKISEFSATYLENHPKMIAARKELNDVERLLRREALKVAESIEGQAKGAASRVATLRKELDKLKIREGEANLSDVNLTALQRDANAQRTLLESLLARYADANARVEVNVKQPEARIIQRAVVPTKVFFPQRGPVLLLSSLAGLLGGLGLAFLTEVMRSTSLSARRAAVVEPLLERSPIETGIASAPPAPQPAPQQAAARPIRAESQPQRTVSTPLQSSPATQRVNLPPILPARAATQTPPTEPVGATKPAATTADTAVQLATALIKLKDDYKIYSSRFAGQTKFKTDVALFVVATARAISEQNKKVLVIDADPASHALEPLFDLERGVGLSDLVEGKTDFTKIIRRDQQSTAHVVSYGLSESEETSTQLDLRMPNIIGSLADVYDCVIVHAGDKSPTTPESLLGCKSVVMIVPQNGQRDLTEIEQGIHNLGAESVMHVTLMQETILS